MTVTTLTPRKQSIEALERAQSTRMDLVRLRKRIAHGDGDALQGIYLDPPPEVCNLRLHEPLEWAPGFGPVKVMDLSRAAVTDGVNLLMPFNRASERSRLWVLSNIRVHRNGRVSMSRGGAPTPRPQRPPAPLSEFVLIDNEPLAQIVSSMVRRLETTWELAAYHSGFRRADSDKGAGAELRMRLGLVSYREKSQQQITVMTAMRICDALEINYDDAGIPA